MPKTTDRRPSAVQADGRVRVVLTLTPYEAAMVDAVRGIIPLATYCRNIVVEAMTPKSPETATKEGA